MRSSERFSSTSAPARRRSVVLQARAGFEGEAIFDLPEAAKIRDLFLFARRGLVFSGGVRHRVAEDLLRMKSVQGWERLCLWFEMLGQLADVKKPGFLASASFSPELGERDGRRLTAVCKYVNESSRERVRHDHAATLAGLSPAAFSRFFHKVRIGHACRRLMEDDTSVLEIAFASGFNNLSNFNRHFLKFKGLTPRAYRKLTNHPAA